MAQLSWEQVAAGAVDSLPTPARDAVNVAKGFACGLYRDYEQFFGNTAPQGPLEGLKRGVWDKICGPGLPPVPTSPPPWNGDSCACVPYRVPYRTTDNGVPIFPGAAADVTGPIYGIRKQQTGPTSVAYFLQHGQCSGGQLVGVASTPLPSGNDKIQVSLGSPQRLGTGTGCQTPPAPPPPVPPPPDRQRERGDINISPNVSINVPVTLVSPITNVDLSPKVEVNVGPVNVNFDLGGINVDISPSFNPVVIVPPIPLPPPGGGTPRPPSLPPSGGDCPDPCEVFDYERIEEAIEAERKYYARSKQEFGEEGLGSGRSGMVDLPPGTRFVKVQVTVRPKLIKSQAGISAPDVLYAGWCSWGRGFPGIRTPIHYDEQVFPVEEFSTKFTWTLYDGGSATITAIIRGPLEECETNECRSV